MRIARFISFHPQRQRGSIYITVMAVAMIITVIGLGAIFARRVQLKTLQNANQLTQAQRYAHSALQLAVQQLNDNPDWREGPTSTNPKALGQGTIELAISDPVDDDVSDSPYDPIQIIATAVYGNANFRLAAQFDAQLQPSPLDATLHTRGSIEIEGTVLSADHPLFAKGSVEASLGAQVYADVVAKESINGAEYKGVITPDSDSIDPPDDTVFFDDLQARATAINVNNIPKVGENVLINPGFEDNLNQWFPFNNPAIMETPPTITPTQSVTRPGSDGAVAVTNRIAFWQGPYQNISNYAAPDTILRVEGYAKAMDVDFPDACIEIMVVNHAGFIFFFQTQAVAVPANGAWAKIQGDIQLSYPGKLWWAEAKISTTNSLENFYADDLSVFPLTSNTPRVIENVTLSAKSNPFGAVNTQGVYQIDCGGADLIIRNCRIQGSLVLINPGSNSQIQGSVHWQTNDPSLAALAVKGDITIATDTAPLSELTTNTNFNRNTPWPINSTSTDTDRADAYPSYIQGLIYATDNITFLNNPTLRGTTVALGDIIVQSQTLTITYDPQIKDNPPAGFNTTPPILKLANASLHRDIR